ncbi:MAG: RNA polymerase sigma factor [Candidatus Cloacimonetes bacterium]|nr:RNA polymerase sigma factor [Candidatus Cloacimonadota bacterium]
MRPRDRERDDALRRVVARHARAMIAVARRYERDERDVDEIVADAITLAFHHGDLLAAGTEAQIRSWLLRTVRKLCANHVRREQTRRKAFDRLAAQPLPLVPSAEEQLIEFEMLQEEGAAAHALHTRVESALAGLPAEQRALLIENALGRRSVDIAKEAGVSDGSVRKRLFLARRAFLSAFYGVDVDSSSAEPASGTPRGGDASE